MIFSPQRLPPRTATNVAAIAKLVGFIGLPHPGQLAACCRFALALWQSNATTEGHAT